MTHTIFYYLNGLSFVQNEYADNEEEFFFPLIYDGILCDIGLSTQLSHQGLQGTFSFTGPIDFWNQYNEFINKIGDQSSITFSGNMFSINITIYHIQSILVNNHVCV